MVFGEIVLLQYHPHQLEMVGRMSSDANRISDSVVLDDTRFVTGYIKKNKQKQMESESFLDRINYVVGSSNSV